MTDKNEIRWPDFFIVGAIKAGTTSLYEYLKDIPSIYMPTLKEPHYFAPSVPTDSYLRPIRDKGKYLRLFSTTSETQIVGESSASYLADPEAPDLIHKDIPNAKIIILLRNPIDRAFSHYLLSYERRWDTRSFTEAIRYNLQHRELNHIRAYVTQSLYYLPVKRYFETFGRDFAKIIVFEQFIREPELTVHDVLEFLGSPSQKVEIVYQAHNPYSVPRWSIIKTLLQNEYLSRGFIGFTPPRVRSAIRKFLFIKANRPSITDEDRALLREIFLEDVVQLEKLLGYTLPWAL